MIEETFLCCHGVGPITQNKICEMGIHNWEEFLKRPLDVPLGEKLLKGMQQDISLCRDAMEAGDIDFLVKRFPVKEHWRILKHYSDDLSYFDIETTGLSMNSSEVTVIGCLHKGKMHRFVSGENLDDFVDLLEDIKILVSFNGSSFDVPRILNHFSLPELDCAHLDLRWICYHYGFEGGLKKIEQQLGFERTLGLFGISGADAVMFWERWKRHGDEKARNILINYCCEDVQSLENIAMKLIEFDGTPPN